MKKSRKELTTENHELRRALQRTRDAIQEGRADDAANIADAGIGETHERVDMPPSTEPDGIIYPRYSVCAWSPHPTPDTVPPTQVHIVFDLSMGVRTAVRLKSPRAVDELLCLLGEYRRRVWGSRPS